MSRLDQVRAWITQHKVALGGTAAAGVAGVALLRRRKPAAAAASATYTPVGGYMPATAGLSGTPNTSGTDYGNQVQDQFNQVQRQIDTLTSTISDALRPPDPAPKPDPAKDGPTRYTDPGAGAYTVSGNDTLGSLIKRIYGDNPGERAYAMFRAANPELISAGIYGDDTSLSAFAGKTLVLPSSMPTHLIAGTPGAIAPGTKI